MIPAVRLIFILIILFRRSQIYFFALICISVLFFHIQGLVYCNITSQKLYIHCAWIFSSTASIVLLKCLKLWFCLIAAVEKASHWKRYCDNSVSRAWSPAVQSQEHPLSFPACFCGRKSAQPMHGLCLLQVRFPSEWPLCMPLEFLYWLQ